MQIVYRRLVYKITSGYNTVQRVIMLLCVFLLAGSLREFGVLIANVEEERERMVKLMKNR